MSVVWSTQSARRFRVCAVLAMNVPHLGIHTLWRFSCASTHSFFVSTGQKEGACLCLPCRSINIGFFKTLGLNLRCAVVLHSTLFLLQETREEAYITNDALIS